MTFDRNSNGCWRIASTGTVTFKDGATTLGTGTLNGGGQATFSISALAAGSHSITAVYGGDQNFGAATSAALTQSVAVPLDSVHLRALQVVATKIAAQNSGQAISGAIDSAIADGFSDDCSLMTPSASGLRITSCAKQTTTGSVKRAFAAVTEINRPAWLVWADTRGVWLGYQSGKGRPYRPSNQRTRRSDQEDLTRFYCRATRRL